MSSPARHALVLVSLLVASGCQLPKGDKNHVLLLDHDGMALDPTRTERTLLVYPHYPRLSEEERLEYLRNQLGSIRQYASSSGAPRVVLFINGGLNSNGASVERATELTDCIGKDPSDPGYPVFVGWDSDLFSSWVQHAFVVRRGSKNPLLGLVSWPLFIAEDLIRGLIHLPQDLIYYNTDTYWRGYYAYQPDTIDASRKVATELAGPPIHEPGEPILANGRGDPVEFETDPDATKGESVLGFLAHHIVQLTCHVWENVLIDGFGTSAWNEMERRTHLLFDSEDSSRSGSTHEPPLTAFEELLGGLAQIQRDHPALQVDLICHSMGCIVANKILQLDNAPANGSPRVPIFHDIVYMGAACSIADYQASVFPYLARHSRARMDGEAKPAEETHIYHVTLHERMENHEATAFGLVPFGSLLVWIDSYYSHTLTPADRVLGRFTNLMNSYQDTPQDLRDQVHIRAYGLEDTEDAVIGRKPVIHGDFDDAKFWRRAFFQPDSRRGWHPKP